VYAAGLVLALTGAIVGAQGTKVSSPDDLDKVMKKAGPALQATGKAIASGNVAEARTQLATVRQAVLDSQAFWVEHKKDDAVKFNKDTIAKIDELTPMLASDSVDPAKATATLKEVGGACRSCHEQYRTRDSENNYILKPGSVG
jgi:cytochrome c556